ncbi:DUF503 domain-containing protein [Nocardiopsis sp. NPDC050513]|uniref:DUF503 domain-containing protein n=1 Tax=Nocardiopsis sp. NPDC050513 TaxID=3364338 RepID=UPI00379D03AE
MFIGALTLDVLLGDVHSLKEKRSVVRPVIADLRRTFLVAVSEAGEHDLYRRTKIGVAVVAPSAAHVRELMDACERFVAARPELELLSARQRLFNEEED